MALEDFERELAKEQAEGQKRKRDRSPGDDKSKRRHHHRHHHHHSKRDGSRDREEGRSHRRHRKHREREDGGGHGEPHSRRYRSRSPADAGNPRSVGVETTAADAQPQRDSWMETPSSMGVEYVQRRQKEQPKSAFVKSSEPVAEAGEEAFNQHLRETEPEKHLQDAPSDFGSEDMEDLPAQHEVDFVFGDAGSSWRMTRLRATYTQAKESGKPLEEIARQRYGDLRAFDDAREEERELRRRETLGPDYVGNEKPSGDLFQERKLQAGLRRDNSRATAPQAEEVAESEDEFEMARAQGQAMREKSAQKETVPLDQTALNRLKAQLMKAKLSKAPNYDQLQAEYDEAVSVAARTKDSGVVVLNKMESRSLAGGRQGEVNVKDNTKRGRERGHVEENEDMSIDDMVRQERRSKYNNDGKAFAERIAKDAKFDNDLDYMDENASKLAKSVQKSDINLRNVAVGEYQKMKRILDTCPLCSHEDTDTPPVAPIVSLATRTYLTLPTSPEITPYGFSASVVPIQHRVNLLECDDDEWEEIRNFMKSLTRFYYSLKPSRHVIFYENAAHEGRKRHASLEAVPLPMKYADTASQFFKEAILSSDEEWTQHKKVIDTLRKAEDGAGKMAFRKSMVSELPYFHVWFRLDGGYGHVVEDPRRWPKGDLFAREIIGGMLDVGPDVIKRQGRWKKGDTEMEQRVKDFRQRWEKFDWTKALLEAE